MSCFDGNAREETPKAGTDYAENLEAIVKEMTVSLRAALMDGRLPAHQQRRIRELLTRSQLLLTAHELTARAEGIKTQTPS